MAPRTIRVVLLALALGLAACGGGDSGRADHGRPSPGSGAVRLEPIGEFTAPVYVTQPPGDGHLYVVEQGGRILRVGATGSHHVFLDLSRRVSAGGEQGLLSMAFAPSYAHSGLVYVDYTNRAGDTRVVEYTARGAAADPASARVLLRIDQPFANHNGGQLEFGPDGLLYIGLGDGGSEGDPQRNGQDLETPLGKILRIDPRPSGGAPYTIPPRNPFVGRHAARPEIYAYGLRNPWRFSFDRRTGALWIGDVGQGELEEIDGVPRGGGSGANFGWSAFEGTAPYNSDQRAHAAIRPVLEYDHDQGCSVTGGYVVRDPSLPALRGRYLYGDYCSGELRSFVARPGAPARDDRALGIRVPSLSSFGEDSAGHVYAVSLDGRAYRLVEEKARR